jgi:hypothetical protein
MDKKLSVVGFILGAKELLKMKRESATVVVVVVAAVWWSIFGFFCLGIWNLSCVYLYCFLSVWNWVEWESFGGFLVGFGWVWWEPTRRN